MPTRPFAAALLAIAAVLPASAADVRIEKDVPYLGPDRTEKLDLYLPADAAQAARRPGVVVIHGGGWTGGEKGAGREQNIGRTLAAAGYVCASIDYRLSAEKDKPVVVRLESVWPQNLHDCKEAVRFLRRNAEKYRVDADHIGAIGGSAGGHLAAMLAVTDDDDGLEPPAEGKPISTRLQAVVPLYGPLDLVQRARESGDWDGLTERQRQLVAAASPVTYVTSDDPPALILHGTADKLVPVSQSESFYAALQKAKVPAQLVVLEGAPHSFDLQPKQRDLRPLVIGFLDKHLKPKR